MRVDRIYTRSIVGTTPNSTVEEAAALMRKYHVGALLVTEDAVEDEGAAVGMITDRDVVVQAVARGFDVRELHVADLMTPTVAGIPREADLHEALELMRTAGVRRLVVTDAGRVVGMLSMDDVIDGLAADLSSLAGLVRAEVARECEEVDEDADEDQDAPVRVTIL